MSRRKNVAETPWPEEGASGVFRRAGRVAKPIPYRLAERATAPAPAPIDTPIPYRLTEPDSA